MRISFTIPEVFAGLSRPTRSVTRVLGRVMAGALAATVLVGCKNLTGSDQRLPAGTPDPSSFNTVSGALGLRGAALYDWTLALRQYVVESGLLTDELTDYQAGAGPGTILSDPSFGSDLLDERMLTESRSGIATQGGGSYGDLQRVRGAANQAIGALAMFGDTLSSVRGELYAVEGYTEILLADLYCSGVPLSTLDYGGDYTYHGGSTTQQVYTDALLKLDSAIALAGDSTRILNFARVVKGRALLDMDSAASAARVVADVPTDFGDSIALQWSGGTLAGNFLNGIATVADSEGLNGFPYRSSQDPRTGTVPVRGSGGRTLYFPRRYANGLPGAGSGYAQFVTANGIEARLIEAEAALRRQDYNTWLGILNTLRQTVTVAGQTGPLNDLTDPGSSPRDSARVALLFDERAVWLFLGGHRQGDLRRVIRQYHWTQTAVYPTGVYRAPGLGRYGSDVTVPIPDDETPNPLFHGCIDRNA